MEVFVNFWDNALPLMKKKGIKQRHLCDITGKTSASVSDWFTYKVMPKADDALKIADLLGVSVRYLITGADDKDLSDREKKLLKTCEMLPDDKFKAVLDVAEIMRKDVETSLRGGSSSGDSDREAK